jgi:hypothetical protein
MGPERSSTFTRRVALSTLEVNRRFERAQRASAALRE